LDRDWYYFLLFGYPPEFIDERMRSKWIFYYSQFCLLTFYFFSIPNCRQFTFVLNICALFYLHIIASSWHIEGV
jgi:hypothetical protein